MMVFGVLLMVALLCAGAAYWIDARGDTKVYGGVVIVLWLVVCACVVLLLAWCALLVAMGTGHLYTWALK